MFTKHVKSRVSLLSKTNLTTELLFLHNSTFSSLNKNWEENN